jgi:hypothetical protein
VATTGTELATAYVTLTVSTRGMESDIRRQFGRVESQAGVTGTRAGKAMGGGLLAAAKGFALPLAAAFGVGAIVSQLSGAVTAGSELQQAVGGADAVFKKEAAGIKKSAENAADALGLSKTEYLELSTVLGAGLKNKGVKDFAKQSGELIGIGADLAAQFGGSTQDAVNALASAMRGESDPIEKYGVSLNETAINAKLVADGVKKVDGKFTDQQKTAARLALITQQTADAQGAFARESDTYAGSQARLAASWDDVKAQVGMVLLPALTDLSDWFLKKGLPAVKEFGGWVKDELWPALKDGWETVRPGFETAKDLILGAFGGDSKSTMKDFGDFLTGSLIPALSDIANVSLPIIAGFMRTNIEAIKLVGDGFIKFRDVVNASIATILGAFIKVTEGFQTMLRALGNVPGFGWAKEAADKMQGPIDKAREIKTALENIPRKRTIEIIASVSMPGRITLPNGERVNIGLREKGGPVRKGQPYIVGEKRPELFVPDSNGKILPSVPSGGGDMGRSTDQRIIVNGDIRTQSPDEFEAEMYRRRRRAALSNPGA